MTSPLGLHQEMLLLTLHDEKGTPHWGTMYAYSLAGAILSELLLRKAVMLKEIKGKDRVVPVEGVALDDAVLEACRLKIEESKIRSLQDWVSHFANMDLKNRIAEPLCDRGILEEEKARVFFFFERRIYPERDPAPEQNLIQRMRHAIFSEDESLPPREAIIVALAKGAGLLDKVFEKSELNARKQRIERISDGDMIAGATREALEAAQAAAIMVSVIMPTIIATTVTTT